MPSTPEAEARIKAAYDALSAGGERLKAAVKLVERRRYEIGEALEDIRKAEKDYMAAVSDADAPPQK